MSKIDFTSLCYFVKPKETPSLIDIYAISNSQTHNTVSGSYSYEYYYNSAYELMILKELFIYDIS